MAQAQDSSDGTLTIGELARRAGIAPSTVRYYERRGLIEPPDREGGWRRYESSALSVLAVIELSKEAGFTLDEIGELLNGFEPATPPSERWAKLAEAKLEELDAMAERIDRMRALLRRGLECGCLTVDDCRLIQTVVERRAAAA
jgi:MerR family transcriptional regulator, redox-sensitive transcriptional activator SoxR